MEVIEDELCGEEMNKQKLVFADVLPGVPIRKSLVLHSFDIARTAILITD
jgi:hypothetical protein